MNTETNVLPVRGDDAIDILLNDHVAIKSLLQRLGEATHDEQRKALVEQLVGSLTIHNATEENLVYPAINKIAGKRLESEKLYHETAEADVLLFEVDKALKEGDTSRFEQKAKKLTDAILEHIESEEKKAFPHLREQAEPREAHRLAESVRTFRKELHFEVPAAV